MATNVYDIQRGKQAITYFHNYAALNFRGVYSLSLDQLVQQAGGRSPDIFLDSLGFTIQTLQANNGFDDGDLKNSMIALANSGQGRLPATQTMWYQALSNQIQNYSWLDAAAATASGTVAEIAAGAESVGNTVLTTFKSIQMFIPLGVLIFAGYYFYMKGRKLAES